MSTLAEPHLQPQARPDSQESRDPQAQAPVVQTRTDFAATTTLVPSMVVETESAVALDHGHRFPSQATTQHQQLHFDLQGSSDSEHWNHHHHHHRQFQHHPDGGPTSVLAPVQTQSQGQSQLEVANIAHFDALGHDFDKQNPFSAEFADRLSRALRRLSRRSSSRSAGSDHGVGPLVLDEDATSVLDYACGSGMHITHMYLLIRIIYRVLFHIHIYTVGQVSRALASYVAQLVGVDISPRMVEVYNTRASTQGLGPHEMRAVGSLAELQQQRFDLAVVSHILDTIISPFFLTYPDARLFCSVLSCLSILVFDGIPPFPFSRTSNARPRRIFEAQRRARRCRYRCACACACCCGRG